MRAVLAIATTNLRRMVRDRSNLFFVFVFPLLLVLLLGVQFGGTFTPALALSAPGDVGPAGQRIVEALEDSDLFDIVRVPGPDAAAEAVADGSAAAAVTIPETVEDAAAGRSVEIGYVARPDGPGAELRAEVDAVIARENARYRAATYASDVSGVSRDEALAVVDAVAADVPGVTVATSRLGGDPTEAAETLGRFDENASGQLLLFVFLTSLTAATALIQTRQWGVSTRMLSTPTSAGQILVGEALGRYLVALVQGVYIVLGTMLLFGVEWGDPFGVAAVLASFSLVSAAAGMLLGSVLRNDAQATGIGILLALSMAAMGGSMAPMEVLPETMRRVAHVVTPHAWGNDAFAELIRRDGTLGDVLPEVGVLLAAGVALLAVASRLLHRTIVRG